MDISRCHKCKKLLMAMTDRTGRTALLAQAQSLPTPAVMALGPGWARRRLPRGVLTVDTLTTAVLTILTARPRLAARSTTGGGQSLVDQPLHRRAR